MTMLKEEKFLYLFAVFSVIFILGCSQTPTGTGTGNDQMINEPPQMTGNEPNQEPPPSPSTGSGTGTGATPQVMEFTIKITHSGGYSPKTFTVNKGDTVKFLANSDPVSHKHGIAIDEFNINIEVAKTPSQTPQVIEFVADEAGSFTIYCKTCEDGPLGPHPWMTGTLTVDA